MPQAARHLPSYQATLDWLLRLEAARGMDFKLARVAEALRLLGDPQASFRAIHVGGTNGKGSVASMAEAILRRAGIKTGLYTSPHLVDFRERIRTGADWIPPDRVVDLIAEIRSVTRPEERGLTFFEVSTILAFLHFARTSVEVGVVEVGLGGRLDATNVLDADVAVLTSVGFDHEAFLGSTLAAIAQEKAGILKPGRAAVIGPLPTEARLVIEQAAMTVGAAPILIYGRDCSAAGPSPLSYQGPNRKIGGIRLPLRGQHQIANAALAVAASEQLLGSARLTEEVVRTGLENVAWPGRLEVVSTRPMVVLDAAHNPDGVRALTRSLPEIIGKRPMHLVFAVMADKSWRDMVEHLAAYATTVTVTTVATARSADVESLAEAFATQVPTEICRDPIEAVRRAIVRAQGDGAVVVAGSIFLLGAIDSLFPRTGQRGGGESR